MSPGFTNAKGKCAIASFEPITQITSRAGSNVSPKRVFMKPAAARRKSSMPTYDG
jgi:hypothetical protein